MAFKAFNVTGVQAEDRLDIISKYISRGSKFILERDLENEYSPTAIKVKVLFKNGGKKTLGFVPDNINKPLAKELAPLMDAGVNIKVIFGMKFINGDGDCRGLQLRYEVKEKYTP